VRTLIRDARATCQSLGRAGADPCDAIAAWAERHG
jgi:hypothetical protein